MDNRLGRPPKSPEELREKRVSAYIEDELESEFLALFLCSRAASKSAFAAELIRLGLEVKRRQLAAAEAILKDAA